MMKLGRKLMKRSAFLRQLRREVMAVRRYQAQAPAVRFSRRDKVSMVMLTLIGIVLMLIAGYLYATYKGKILYE